jgi:ABC-2 type transport system ATP-binding protein
MTDSPVITINRLSKSYGEKLVIDDISLTIGSGQIFALIGLNGQGKTSLIKSIIDLCSADSGNIKIFGLSSSDPNSRSKLTYLPEKFQPSRDLKAIEFLKFNHKLSGNNTDLDENKIGLLCDQLKLERDMLRKKVTSFSKGMVQKLGLIATFSSNYELLILDEPMSGLDPLARFNLRKIMKDYVENGDRTIIFTSHILSDIESLCRDVAILHNKKIIYSGAIQKLLPQEKNITFEEKFLKIIS